MPFKRDMFVSLEGILIFLVEASHLPCGCGALFFGTDQGSMNYFGGIKQCKMYGNLDGFALQNALFGLVFR